MDPTMQSPMRRTFPMPFSGGIETKVPSGPHFYSNRTWIGSATNGIGPRRAFEVLSRYATPGQGGVPSNDGGTVDLPLFGKVRQTVDPDRLMIVNTTEPEHLLHPGNVHRSIVREGDDFYVLTHGYGTGAFPKVNEWTGPNFWKAVDAEIRRELNPTVVPPAYAREVVRDSAAHADIPGRSNVFEFDYPDLPDHPLADGRGSPQRLVSEPVRRLRRRTYIQSQGSAFDSGAPGAPAPMHPQRPLSLNDAYLEYLKRSGYQTQEPAFGEGLPTPPFVSADGSEFSGGLLGRLTALMGTDPRNPKQLAPPPRDGDLRGFYHDDPLQPWLVTPRR